MLYHLHGLRSHVQKINGACKRSKSYQPGHYPRGLSDTLTTRAHDTGQRFRSTVIVEDILRAMLAVSDRKSEHHYDGIGYDERGAADKRHWQRGFISKPFSFNFAGCVNQGH